MTEPTVLVTTTGTVRTLTLNRPAALNSLTAAMHGELLPALQQAAEDSRIRAVLITGAGRGFCAGQDLNDPAMSGDGDGGGGVDVGAVIERHYRPLALRLRTMPVPVIAAVNGVAAGAGANLALCCDFVLAARGASFIQAFSKIGLVPDTGGSWLLVHKIGLARAMGLALTGDKLPAAQAKEWGMIWDLADDPLAAALVLAQRLAAMPTQALVATRHLLREGAARTLHQQLDAERDLQSAMGRTHDYFEGVTAFLEKRPAVFRGE